ncbi:hypothetical protein LWI28_001286 [Acer negundo]|uniref:Uncharacterized protein n=1 Tax=Acer negundo TaxID=4023 RepID=A0AAD5NZ15_ACENE|nr:hypothetical protein LWI28_001286 [Acer negundo]KAK4855609.1 hypothetical protein QYF36_008993 [Acer negundo]
MRFHSPSKARTTRGGLASKWREELIEKERRERSWRTHLVVKKRKPDFCTDNLDLSLKVIISCLGFPSICRSAAQKKAHR